MKYISKTIIALVLALTALLSAIAIGLGIIHITNFIYYIDIDALDIPYKTGYDKSEILKNVDAVMDYLDPFNTDEFHLPSFEYSESGSSHFSDCKAVFNGFYLFGAIAFIILVLMLVFLKKETYTYRLAGMLTLGLPAVAGVAMAVNFDRTFVVFHELLFDNSDWIFDPYTDPIIKVLPQEFFMHCGIFIALCIVAVAVFLFIKGGRKNEQI